MSDLHDPTSRHVVRDDETQLSSKHPWSSQETSLGTRKRWPRIWPVLLILLFLLGGGIYAYAHFTMSGLPSPAGADGVANFTVGTHPIIVINGASGAIHVHINSLDHVVTLRAVSVADSTDNTAIPYTRSSDGRTFTFDVSSFSNDALDLAVPTITDLQITATDGAIVINGVSGQMVLSASNAPIKIIGSSLDGTSSLNADNAGLILNTVTFTGGANLVNGTGDVTVTNVKFHGPATLRSRGSITLVQDAFENTATIDSSNNSLSLDTTTFAGAASLMVENSGSITTTNTTFKSTGLLSGAHGVVSLTSTTFVGGATITGADTFTTTQATFHAGATVTTAGAMNISAHFGTQGSYQFITTNSDIDLKLSSDLPFHLDASTNNGSITSDFSTIRVTTDPTTHAAQAHGDVSQGGDAPKLKFALTTDNGAVRIHKT